MIKTSLNFPTSTVISSVLVKGVTMAEEGMMPFSVVSIIEDVIRQHGTRLSDVNFASRKAEEACMIPFFFL